MRREIGRAWRRGMKRGMAGEGEKERGRLARNAALGRVTLALALSL